MAQGRGNAICLLFVASLLAVAHTVVGVDHIIGGTQKWDYPPGTDKNYYATWAATQNFVVGDSAVFNYVANQHNVQVVTANEYTSCAQSNGQTYTTGKDTIPLTTAGKHYFICSVIGHCAEGMKIMIDVKAAAAAPPPATTTPPTTSPLPPTEAPVAAPVLPPPPSTANSVSACLSLVAVMAAYAFGVLFLCY